MLKNRVDSQNPLQNTRPSISDFDMRKEDRRVVIHLDNEGGILCIKLVNGGNFT